MVVVVEFLEMDHQEGVFALKTGEQEPVCRNTVYDLLRLPAFEAVYPLIRIRHLLPPIELQISSSFALW